MKTPTQGSWLHQQKHRQLIVSKQQIPKKGKMHKLTLPTIKTKLIKDSNHWPLISLNINGLKLPIKRHRLTDWI